MSEQESRPTQSGGAAPEEFADSGPQITIAEQRTILLDDARKHRKHVRAAHEFAAQWLDKLLYVVGIGWHHWDGKRWAEDKGGTRAKAAAMETLKAMWGLALGDKELASDVMACSTASGVRGVLELAGSLEGMCAAAADMDADPYLLNCANGTLDLHGLELRPHDPDDRITKVTRAAYVPGARSELWEDFLEQVLPDDHVRSYLARFFGMGLVGKVLEHVFPIATGTGRNGKGVAYTSVLHALGDYGGVADPALMEVVKSNPNAPSPAFFDLRGRRMVVLSETDTKIRLSASVLKRLTGGDPIKARAQRKDPIEFLPSHSFLMVTNHLPELPSKAADPAVWSRVRAVPFDVVIPPDEQDPRLPEKLELAADAILTWMVAGLGEYWERGLDEPEAVQERTSEYAEGQDDVRRFVAEQRETGGHRRHDDGAARGIQGLVHSGRDLPPRPARSVGVRRCAGSARLPVGEGAPRDGPPRVERPARGADRVQGADGRAPSRAAPCCGTAAISETPDVGLGRGRGRPGDHAALTDRPTTGDGFPNNDA